MSLTPDDIDNLTDDLFDNPLDVLKDQEIFAADLFDSQEEWARSRVGFWWAKLCTVHNSNLSQPEVIFSNKMVTCAGRASTRLNRIKLSNHFLENEKEGYDQTIGHELAHIFANRYHNRPCGHGPLWKMVMVKIGLKPTRCHTYSSTIKRGQNFMIKCKCGQIIKLTLRLMQQIGKYRCKKCRTPLSESVDNE